MGNYFCNCLWSLRIILMHITVVDIHNDFTESFVSRILYNTFPKILMRTKATSMNKKNKIKKNFQITPQSCNLLCNLFTSYCIVELQDETLSAFYFEYLFMYLWWLRAGSIYYLSFVCVFNTVFYQKETFDLFDFKTSSDSWKIHYI